MRGAEDDVVVDDDDFIDGRSSGPFQTTTVDHSTVVPLSRVSLTMTPKSGMDRYTFVRSSVISLSHILAIDGLESQPPPPL